MKFPTKTAANASAVVLALALAACSPAIHPDHSAKAQLDFTTGQMITPLSAYLPLDVASDQGLVDQARRVYLGSCMAAAGYSFTATMPSTMIVDDRRFGIWMESYAAKYGFSFMPDPVQDIWDQESAAGGPAWDTALDTCSGKFNEDPETKTIRFTDDEVYGRADELNTQAYDAASKDPEWNEARESWKQCLKNSGLTPPAGAEQWMSKESENLLKTQGNNPSQESIRLASIEARCNITTNLTQRLGDLLASYQQPLIDEHEAELQPLKERKQAVLTAAREYIAAHG